MNEDTYKPSTFYCILIFGSLLFAAGILSLYCLLADLSEYYTFKNAIPVKIAYVEYVKWKESEGAYDVETKYNYTYQGKNYTGTRTSIYMGYDNFGSFQSDLYQRILHFKKNGGELFCYVNAKNPKESVIDNSFRPSRFVINFMVFVIFSALGGYISLSAVKWKKENKKASD